MPDTILLASRDLQLLETRAMLVHYAGYHSLAAATVEAVLDLAGGQAPHLIVLDHTFTRNEHEQVRTELERRGKKCGLLSLNELLTPPQTFLDTCARHLAFLDGGARGQADCASGSFDDVSSPPAGRRPERKTPSRKPPGDGHRYDLSCSYLG
jgi:hypothetical protein